LTGQACRGQQNRAIAQILKQTGMGAPRLSLLQASSCLHQAQVAGLLISDCVKHFSGNEEQPIGFGEVCIVVRLLGALPQFLSELE
jgi:hypothetical protein